MLITIIFWNDNVRQPSEAHSSTSSAHMHQLNLQSGSRTVGKDVKQAVVIALSRLRDIMLFTDILAGFTFNNRVLRLPAIVLLNTTFRPGNSGLLRIYVQAF